MTQKDLIKEMSVATNLRIKDIELMMSALVSLMGKHLQDGEDIHIKDFGSFGMKENAKTKVVCPKNGKLTEIRFPKRAVFRASNTLKGFINASCC